MSYTGSVPEQERAVDWRTFGTCSRRHADGRPLFDPDLWFPDGTTGAALVQIGEAKAVCNRHCPVVDWCLQWALETGQDHGVFGGLSEEERRAMKRRSARQPKREPVDALVFNRTASLEDACRELYVRYTELRDDHVVWVADRTQVKILHRERTFGQICFQAVNGRWPDGPVYRSCEVGQCVAALCLTDKTIRAANKAAAVTV